MSKLTYRQRQKLPAKAFAIDSIERRYPIHDISHARNALARVSTFGTEEEKRKVREAVYRKYPELSPEGKEIYHKGNIRIVETKAEKVSTRTGRMPKGRTIKPRGIDLGMGIVQEGRRRHIRLT